MKKKKTVFRKSKVARRLSMKKTIFIFCVLLVPLYFAGVANAEVLTSISGRVIAEDTGEGIGGVYVQADPDDGGPVNFDKTDEKGFYVLTDVKPGKYMLSFHKKGDMYVDYPLYEEIEVPSGKNLVNMNHVMELGGAVSGILLDADGTTPIRNVRVSILIPGRVPLGTASSGITVTDASGKFLIQGLPVADNYEIEIAVPARAWPKRTIAIEKGKTTETNFVLNWDDITGISGYVKSSIDGQPIENAEVSLIDSSGNEVGNAYTDSTGKYSIVGVLPGTYGATAFWPTGEGWIDKVDITVNSGKSTEINFDFEKPAPISFME